METVKFSLLEKILYQFHVLILRTHILETTKEGSKFLRADA